MAKNTSMLFCPDTHQDQEWLYNGCFENVSYELK